MIAIGIKRQKYYSATPPEQDKPRDLVVFFGQRPNQNIPITSVDYEVFWQITGIQLEDEEEIIMVNSK